jgi:hypothetical protein
MVQIVTLQPATQLAWMQTILHKVAAYSTFTSNTKGHLAVTDEISEMLVSWISNSPSIPTVQYGTSKYLLSMNSTGTFSTYDVDELCGGNAATNYISPGLVIFDLVD